ncbi:AbiV family abortive infection protein [Chitinophagaceae bacterium LB-8]|uniref:AbiV family abortive infection protein n=1 Tax=Paraflavisolibacter caeni TaxID=2982496 RepID=A0A9X2XN24_9BACT|nr:AbiV family abortive infection protein [Paraflavisolibacter caeni]MCU7548143.1 AbiV family abortive infection protein [Paraflavisolibacter caeni]
MEVTFSQNFLNISRAECANVYLVVMKNANTHFRCAEILAPAGEYSNAVAHLILGTEEIIKALLLFLESKDFDLRKVEGYKSLFRNHRARHSIIKEFYSVIMALKSLVSIEKKKKDENAILYYAKAVTDVLYGVISGIENYQWWDNADNLKQECFYVDYKSAIKDPQSISSEQYQEAYKNVSVFKNDIRIIIAALTRANNKQLNDFRIGFEEANFKGILEATIKRSAKR